MSKIRKPRSQQPTKPSHERIRPKTTPLPKSRARPLGFCRDDLVLYDFGNGPEHIIAGYDEHHIQQMKMSCDCIVVRPMES